MLRKIWKCHWGSIRQGVSFTFHIQKVNHSLLTFGKMQALTILFPLSALPEAFYQHSVCFKKHFIVNAAEIIFEMFERNVIKIF